MADLSWIREFETSILNDAVFILHLSICYLDKSQVLLVQNHTIFKDIPCCLEILFDHSNKHHFLREGGVLESHMLLEIEKNEEWKLILKDINDDNNCRPKIIWIFVVNWCFVRFYYQIRRISCCKVINNFVATKIHSKLMKDIFRLWNDSVVTLERLKQKKKEKTIG